MRCKCGTGRDPVTGKMPVPQVLPLKGQHYISKMMGDSIFRYAIALGFDEAFGFDEVLSFDDLIVLMANPDILQGG